MLFIARATLDVVLMHGNWKSVITVQWNTNCLRVRVLIMSFVCFFLFSPFKPSSVFVWRCCRCLFFIHDFILFWMQTQRSHLLNIEHGCRIQFSMLKNHQIPCGKTQIIRTYQLYNCTHLILIGKTIYCWNSISIRWYIFYLVNLIRFSPWQAQQKMIFVIQLFK